MSATPTDNTPNPYGLHRPTMSDAREAMHRVHGYSGRSTWQQLLHTAGLTGNETGDDALQQLLTAMTSLDPVSRLCAQALRIRLTSHTHLSAAHHSMTRSPA